MLVVNHATLASYETVNILNYFGFPIAVEEDDFWGSSRKDFQFSKTDEYPFLIIDSSHDEMPSCELTNRENILSFLFNKSLIGSYKSYSAYEQQGLDFLDLKLIPAVDEMLRDWRTLGQFHMKPKHFKQGKMSIEGHTNVKRYLYKLITYFQQLIGDGRSALTRDERYA